MSIFACEKMSLKGKQMCTYGYLHSHHYVNIFLVLFPPTSPISTTLHPPLSSPSNSQLHRTSKASDDEYEGKAWLKTSKSFDNLDDINRKLGKDQMLPKKGKTARFITRIFKRKSVTPAILKRSKGKSSKGSQRDSMMSAASSVSENRERCLTASISMPDISSKWV